MTIIHEEDLEESLKVPFG